MIRTSLYYALLEKEVDNKRKHWFQRYPVGYFVRFVRDGLIPFVKSHGYHINHEFPTLVKHFTSWIWSHKKLSFIKEKYDKTYYMHYQSVNNHGTQDDYVWFCSMFPSDEVSIFCQTWCKTEFLDNSVVGQAQEIDLLNFIWNHIDLHASKAHADFYVMQEENDEDELTTSPEPQTKQYDFIE